MLKILIVLFLFRIKNIIILFCFILFCFILFYLFYFTLLLIWSSPLIVALSSLPASLFMYSSHCSVQHNPFIFFLFSFFSFSFSFSSSLEMAVYFKRFNLRSLESGNRRIWESQTYNANLPKWRDKTILELTLLIFCCHYGS